MWRNQTEIREKLYAGAGKEELGTEIGDYSYWNDGGTPEWRD